jgi:hypothetical protein
MHADASVFKFRVHDNVLAPFDKSTPTVRYMAQIYMRVASADDPTMKYHVYFPEDSETTEFVEEKDILPQKGVSRFWSKKRDAFKDQTFSNPTRGDGNKKGTYTIEKIESERRINTYVCRHEDGSYPYYFDIGYVLRILHKNSKKKKKNVKKYLKG